LIARFLVLNDGHFCPLFSLANSIRLVYLSNIYLIDINWLVVGKNFITAQINNTTRLACWQDF
jgi:hypothetical protein